MTDAPTIYDAVAYPTAVFAQTHPSHLAAMAHLHGLVPPAVATARVLEIGCGDAMNLLAMAAAYPQASFTGFDLAPTVIARGAARAAAAGLDNVHLQALDLLDAAEALPGPFDYVIAHGVYAWVPGPVRAALMEYVGRVLAPDGVAFISYNALPGGHFRMAVRDLMLNYVTPEMDPATRIDTARRALEEFIALGGSDDPVPAAFRHQAKATLNQVDGLLFHDELSEVYAPQRLRDVAAAAEGAGLKWLTDAGRALLMDGFLSAPDCLTPEQQERAALRQAQERDYVQVRFFRRSLFVRAEARPSRIFDPARVADLWAVALCDLIEGDIYRGEGGEEFQIKDPELDRGFRVLVERRPARIRVGELLPHNDRLTAFMQLFDRGSLALHYVRAPFAEVLSDQPQVSQLARAMLAEGLDTVCTFDHSTLKLDDEALRNFLAIVDGNASLGECLELARRARFHEPHQYRSALEIALRKGLLMAS